MTGVKTAIATLLLSGIIATAIQGPAPSGRVIIAWDYPTGELSSDLTFKVYASSDVTIPVGAWQVFTNVIGTNTNAAIQIVPGFMGFAVTASNMWGESDFSEILKAPNLPRSANNLTIRKALP